MNQEIISTIDAIIDNSTERLATDTIKLVNIKSVQGKSEPGAPFGIGPKRILEEVLHMGKREGFYCTDYNVGVVSIAMKDAKPDLGIWLHGDVVCEGDGWNFEPYLAVKHKDCVIGRGAADNKGQLAAIFNLFKIFKDLNIALDYNPAIYVGSNEETGMRDIIGIEGSDDAKGFINVSEAPKLSLVPDSGFPIGYGGKGGLSIILRSNTPLHGFSLIAGQDDAPGIAAAVFERTDIPDTLDICTVTKNEKKTLVTSFSPPRHGASPDPNGNMITQISSALLDADLVKEEDRYILEFFRRLSSDIYGEILDIKTEHNLMGSLTVFSKKIDFIDGYCDLHLNIRYPIGITYEQIVKNIEKTAKTFGFTLTKATRGINPYISDPENKIVKELAEIANSVTGDNKKPYTLNGATYAHVLPNAYAYGMSSNLPPSDFPNGHGGAHGIDEAVSLSRLKRAMKIYSRALLRLNEIEWI